MAAASRNLVLVIDDDPWVPDYISDIIEAFFGLKAVKAYSIESARNLFFANCDALTAIVADLSVDGAQSTPAVREMVAASEDLAVVFVTGQVENERDLSKAVGRPVALVMKPFGLIDLKTALESRLASAGHRPSDFR